VTVEDCRLRSGGFMTRVLDLGVGFIPLADGGFNDCIGYHRTGRRIDRFSGARFHPTLIYIVLLEHMK
jgi:hypothetical protein